MALSLSAKVTLSYLFPVFQNSFVKSVISTKNRIYLFIYFYLIRYLQSIKEYLEPLAKNLFLAYRRATVKKVN